VSNIDHVVCTIWWQNRSITARHRQPSVTESAVMLPPKAGKHHVLNPTSFDRYRADQVEISAFASDPFKSEAIGWLDSELRAPS
jgi:hypothetical protein